MRVTIATVVGAAALVAGCQWLPGTDEHAIAEARRDVAATLRDPASAQFREVRAHKQKDGTTAVCGEVNGRNAFGGYAGFQNFVTHEGRVHILDDDVDLTNVSAIEAQTEALRAQTTYCMLQGRTLEEVEAETAAIQKRTAEMKARQGA